MVRVYHKNISVEIKKCLETAESEVILCVAWFTNRFLSHVLKNLLLQGKKVTIIISDSSHNFKPFPIEYLIKKGASIMVCPTIENKFMHHKFCLIDGRLAISGSYNWTANGDIYHENIVVIENNNTVQQYRFIFEKVLSPISRPYEVGLKNNALPVQKEIQEDNAYIELEDRFENLAQMNIRKALDLGIPINTDWLYSYIDRYGAVGAAKQLSSSQNGQKMQGGFMKLVERNQLNLSFEWLVVQPEFKPLFSDDVIAFAKEKLEKGNIEAQLSKDKSLRINRH